MNNNKTDKPANILLLMIDDMGWMDLGCYGSSFYETPTIDRLATQGLRFSDAYASCPVCSPTRASVLSGKYPARVGVTQFIGGHAVGRLCDVPYHWGLPASEYALPKALRAGGYQTWHVGKWHLGEREFAPEKHGFEINIAGCGWGAPKNGYFAPWGQLPGMEEAPEGTYLTDALTDHAIRLIKDRDQARPFFLNLWHYAVHTPMQAPAELVAKYEQKAKDLGLDQSTALVEGESFSCQHKGHLRVTRRQFQSHATYAAMMENLDTNIGRVLNALDEMGLSEDILVLFTSDNGGLSTAEGAPTCNKPLLEGKGWCYEGGTRVCQIARWPGHIEAGTTTAEPVTSTDIYPTCLSAAGLPPKPQQHVDGVDLLPLMRDGMAPQREAIFWHYPHYSNQGDTPACAIRMGDWKLIEHFEADHALELYNLAEDLGEEHNRAADEPQITNRLHARLVAWRHEVEALIPKPNPNWQAPPRPADCDPASV